MKVLVVGGTGMIGAHTARLLGERGAEVTVMARSAPHPDSPVADLPVLTGDYLSGEVQPEQLAPFEAVVFAAGQDIRHVSPASDEETWQQLQGRSVPAFLEVARTAGVRRAVLVGSYYHQAMPELVGTNAYVRSRQVADDDSRALATDGFSVCSVNPPNIVGMIPGRSTSIFAKQVAWARGELTGKVPDFAPAGGTNYMSVRSLAEAIHGALVRGESGAAYLVGDENLTFRDYFQLIFDAVGAGRVLEERDEEHPMLPDPFIVSGRGHVLAYEPDPAVVELLGYRRHDVAAMIGEMVADVARR